MSGEGAAAAAGAVGKGRMCVVQVTMGFLASPWTLPAIPYRIRLLDR
jgi:hypothetical protein